MKLKVVKIKDKEIMQVLFERKNGRDFEFHAFLCESNDYTNPLYGREFTIEDAWELIEYMKESFPDLKRKFKK